jgi:hypothetical protein
MNKQADEQHTKEQAEILVQYAKKMILKKFEEWVDIAIFDMKDVIGVKKSAMESFERDLDSYINICINADKLKNK